MNIAVDELAISLLKKPLNECSTDELRQLVQQYPWFGPVQLLYAKKLQAGSPSLYEDQVQKASLYFQNRVWLQYLLNDNTANAIVAESKTSTEEKAPEQHIEQVKPEVFSETILNETKEADAILEQATEEPAEQIEMVAASHEPMQAETLIEQAKVEPATYNEPPAVLNQPDEAEIIPEPVKEEAAAQGESEPVLEIKQFRIEPVDTSKPLFTFEPYHTIDYFASQGIKFKEEDKPKDVFSQQLKSFTEWLKVMKRVPVSEITANTETGAEKKVEEMAEHSLAERHVLTEAMAEVWEKQGNKAKAEEIYLKLSLLDPLKSSYFAAKIEALKKTS
jgi:hypothetical protein